MCFPSRETSGTFEDSAKIAQIQQYNIHTIIRQAERRGLPAPIRKTDALQEQLLADETAIPLLTRKFY